MSFLKRRILSFKYAIQGIRWAFSTQANLWIHLVAAATVIFLGFYFDIKKIEWIILIGCIASVFTLEFINTALEWLVDSVFKEKHSVAGKIKDVAAASVFVVAMGTVIIGTIIFYPYFVTGN